MDFTTAMEERPPCIPVVEAAFKHGKWKSLSLLISEFVLANHHSGKDSSLSVHCTEDGREFGSWVTKSKDGHEQKTPWSRYFIHFYDPDPGHEAIEFDAGAIREPHSPFQRNLDTHCFRSIRTVWIASNADEAVQPPPTTIPVIEVECYGFWWAISTDTSAALLKQHQQTGEATCYEWNFRTKRAYCLPADASRWKEAPKLCNISRYQIDFSTLEHTDENHDVVAIRIVWVDAKPNPDASPRFTGDIVQEYNQWLNAKFKSAC